jgi:hypothetical protein
LSYIQGECSEPSNFFVMQSRTITIIHSSKKSSLYSILQHMFFLLSFTFFLFLHPMLSECGCTSLKCFYKNYIQSKLSQYVSGYGLDDWAIKVRSRPRRKDFSSSLCVQISSGAHPATCTMGTGVLFLRAKARLGCDADHSPPSSAKVENEKELYSSPPSAFMACSGTALAFIYNQTASGSYLLRLLMHGIYCGSAIFPYEDLTNTRDFNRLCRTA